MQAEAFGNDVSTPAVSGARMHERPRRTDRRTDGWTNIYLFIYAQQKDQEATNTVGKSTEGKSTCHMQFINTNGKEEKATKHCT